MDVRMSEAAGLLARAKRVVVFTGAGISAESGVPTFRDALTGLWHQFDAEKLATTEAFERDPALVWGWYESRRATVERVRPNAGHEAIARIENAVVITQNVDDLHERAGSRNVIHLHGSLFAPRCSACGTRAPHSAAPPTDGPLEPPACDNCGSPVRPGVVWFGEPLPQDAFAEAVDQAASCDLLITVGTSGVVYPAAELPEVAARFGAPVIQVNPQPTPLDAVATINLRGTAGNVLPQLVDLRRHG